jgi:GNAT superfamily N-acetyltransferase
MDSQIETKVTLDMRIISVREQPEYRNRAIEYLQQSWQEVSPVIYHDCVVHSIGAENPLPQWYLLEKEQKIIGCAGLITNDFISRMDLYPWLCALFIEEEHRGNHYGRLLIEKAQQDALSAGFRYLNLSTDHVGYYERYNFTYIGQGYHPWGEESRIYQLVLDGNHPMPGV